LDYNLPVRVAIDVGGTFTDLCALNEETGEFIFVKDSTTPSKFAIGVINVIKRSNLKGEQIDRFIGTGSTMVINALTEMKGAKTALITTKGFRDVLEIQRSNRTDIYNFRYQKPKPFVPRRLRIEVEERVDYTGNVLKPLNKDDVLNAAEILSKQGVESVAVAFYNSYANPEHEVECSEILASKLKVPITMSHELTREWREYERTNTAVMNAFVKPKVEQYLTTLEEELRRMGVRIEMHVMQSNGGVSTFEQAKKTPIYQVESGPIGGVIGATVIGKELGIENLITLDVGGTTAKTSLVDSGKIKVNTDYHIGRTQFFSGYPVKVPVVDIVEIGNGGGSIAWIDELGSLRVGPVSAGADPGPACYGKGGKEPTLTDAFVLCNIIDADYFLGGEMKLKPELSKKAFEKVSKHMGMSILDVALGTIRIATANMVNALKLVSVRRGYDPRDFVLVAFGGGGPMFATSLARELGIRKVIVPRVPGVFSAWGMLMTDIRHDYIQTKVTKLSLETLQEIMKIVDNMTKIAYKQLNDEGVGMKDVRFEASLDIRYLGQEHTVNTPVPVKKPSKELLSLIEKRFTRLHYKQYTFNLTDPLEVVNVHLTAYGRVKKPGLASWKPSNPSTSTKERKVFFEGGETRASVYNRDNLPSGFRAKGPAIVEEPTSTTILRKGDTLQVDRYGNLIIEVGR
jgi:N-methylhydantoinase A